MVATEERINKERRIELNKGLRIGVMMERREAVER